MSKRNVTFLIGANYDNLKKNLSAAEKRFKKFERTTSRIGQTLTTRLTLPIVGLGAMAVKQAGNLEKLRTQLDILTGSAREGEKAFKRLQEFSARTPFQMDDLVRANNTLLGFGLNADQAYKALQSIGDIAAVTGGDVQAIAMAFGQANAEQKLFTKDIRQLINQGVPAVELLANTMGVAQSEVFDLASQGKITFDILNRAFEEATREGGKFAGGMEKQSKTILGQMSTLKDNVSQIAGAFGEVIVEGLTPYTQKIREAVEAGRGMDKLLIKKIVTFGALAAAIGPTVLLLSKMAKVLAFIASPLAFKIALLAALAGGLAYVIENAEAFEQHIKFIFANAAKYVGENIAKMMAWIGELAMLTGQRNLGLGLMQAAAKMEEAINDINMDEPTASFQNFTEFIESMKQRAGDAINLLTGALFDFNKEAAVAAESGRIIAERFFNGTVPAINATTVAVDANKMSLKDMSKAQSVLTDIANEFTSSFGAGMANVVVQGEKLVDVLENIGKLLLSSAIQKGISLLLTGFSGSGGLLGSLFGGFFADGGTLRPGQWGIVGERGPEAIMATPSGAVITPNISRAPAPAARGGGGSGQMAVVNVYMDSRLVDRQLTELNLRRG